MDQNSIDGIEGTTFVLESEPELGCLRVLGISRLHTHGFANSQILSNPKAFFQHAA
jgi:hypothetical protein